MEQAAEYLDLYLSLPEHLQRAALLLGFIGIVWLAVEVSALYMLLKWIWIWGFRTVSDDDQTTRRSPAQTEDDWKALWHGLDRIKKLEKQMIILRPAIRVLANRKALMRAIALGAIFAMLLSLAVGDNLLLILELIRSLL